MIPSLWSVNFYKLYAPSMSYFVFNTYDIIDTEYIKVKN